MGIKNLITSYPALQEFGLVAKAILPLMTDVNVSRTEKRGILNDAVNGLSDKTFNNSMVADQIMIIINMKEDVCREYPDTESQVNGILEWLPRMSKHRDKLYRKVKQSRKSFGLKL